MKQRDLNKADKQKRLLDAGLAAFLAEGYAGASIERIAAAADVARGTYYLYFKDKEALFSALLNRFLEPLLAVVSDARHALARCRDAESTLPIYFELGTKLAAVLLEHLPEVRLYLHESRAVGAGGDAVRKGSERIEKLTREILANAVKNEVLREHDEKVASLAIVGAIERVVWAYLQGDRGLKPETLPVELLALMRYGLVART
ncbi:TetR/AcrR family transcriptional regulator [bacterium]|nr:TetR/AcrR family transcriptional regulator [bacterium]